MAHKQQNLASCYGFSLVDIMVGMVVGLLTVLVIMQSYAVFEGQKRTTTSGVTAQENGLAALNTMETDIRQAGFGLTTNGAFLCTSINIYHDGSTVSDSGIMAPLLIQDGGGGKSDSIKVLYSSSAYGGIPSRIVKPMPTPSSILTVNMAPGLANKDMILVGTPGSADPCTLMQLTKDPQATGNGYNLNHNSGTSLWNPAHPGNVFTNAPSYGTKARVFNMGSFIDNRYQVLCNTLTVSDGATQPKPACTNQSTFTDATPLVSDIVNIQAQYGIAPANSQSVNCWVNATGANTNTCDSDDWSAPSAADIARIKAVRLAVVVRSSQPEKPDSSGTCSATPSKTAANYPVSWPGGPAIDITSLSNWQCYRYKVYQTIVSLRNVLWANL